MTIIERVNKLAKEQIVNWKLAGDNYKGLQQVETKSLQLSGGACVDIQYNPARIISSSAKVDTKSIAERACFLCAENRPKEQKGIEFEDFTILINPFPIFPLHLTIVHKEHRNQLIKPYIGTMLRLSKELTDYTIFYNGPKCGASAPDHFHFQAGIEGFFPIETDFRTGKYLSLQAELTDIKIYTWNNYGRELITIESSTEKSLIEIFNKTYDILDKMYNATPEPMINILSCYKWDKYIMHLFPRGVHRPKCYFAEGDEQILISPASVDMGGVLIAPRKIDYDKITATQVMEIFKEVSISTQDTNKIIENIR